MNNQKATREELFSILDEMGISHKTINHRPVFTVDEGHDIKASIEGGHTKNLFLKDKDGKFFLICALGDTQIKLNQVHKSIGCARLSFGAEEFMWEFLGVTPGSVTIFGLINDKNKQINLVLDKNIFAHEIINFHPLLNDATTAINTNDLKKFVKNWGGNVVIADFDSDIPKITDLD